MALVYSKEVLAGLVVGLLRCATGDGTSSEQDYPTQLATFKAINNYPEFNKTVAAFEYFWKSATAAEKELLVNTHSQIASLLKTIAAKKIPDQMGNPVTLWSDCRWLQHKHIVQILERLD